MPEDPIGNMTPQDNPRVSNAAGHALLRVFPGTALGRYLHRELIAYKEFGYRFKSDSITEQMISEIVALHNAGVVIRPYGDLAA